MGTDTLHGVGISLGLIGAHEVKGFAAAAYVRTKETRGLTIGIFNRTEELHGVQIGLLNSAGNSAIHWVPGINASF